jgi:hypothetical protein
MPPRFVILAIIAFWLATTAWLIHREILPALQSGEPPPYSIDLADEVSAQTISWKVLQEGKEIGTVHTIVRRQPDRTFRLEGDFKPQRQLELFTVNIRHLRSWYAVTRGGDLRELSVELKLIFRNKAFELRVDGKVENGVFKPDVRLDGKDIEGFALPKLNPVAVAGHGNVLNPLHPLNRLKGLRAGQRWVQPMFDPLSVAVSSLFSPPLSQLHAEVLPGMLLWEGAEVPCWKIEYRQQSDKVAARTWVRREDGLVLQQEASHAGMELILQRGVAR